MKTADCYILHRFPTLVDPLSSAVEVHVQTGDGPPAPTQLHRVVVEHDTFPFTLTSRTTHFFGPEPRPEDCPFLLAYDPAGRLRARFDQAAGDWVQRDLPAEAVGGPVVRPSVRLTFESLRDAEAFLSLVNDMRAAAPPSAAADRTLRELSRGVREAHLIPVATAP